MNDVRFQRLAAPSSLPARLLGFLLSTLLLVLAAMFSLVALTVVAVGGTVFASWLWWKTRTLRRQLRTLSDAPAPAAAQAADAAVIDGEWVREFDDAQPLPR